MNCKLDLSAIHLHIFKKEIIELPEAKKCHTCMMRE